MDELTILQYSGIGLLIVLLIIFEAANFQSGGFSNKYTYVYYTCSNEAVRIKRTMVYCYKVYVTDADLCPLQTKRDRYGTYFKIKARSAQDAEYKIDELYRAG